MGEPVPQNVNDRWAAHKMMYNMYGPTEATCGATIKRLLPNQPVTIGIPNPSTRICILNKRQRLVPPGVIGEICLAGIQISEGYVGMPAETAKSFIADPIYNELGERMYRTGDYGYWNQDGELVCMGRFDRQIKLRGFRIDLNDLEIQMRRAAPIVDSLAVVHRKNFLVAVVQPSSVDVAAFRSRIAKCLPVHAVPRYVTAVDSLPLTTAGKVDYEKVARIGLSSTTQSAMVSDSSTVQEMVSIWRNILDLAPEVPIDAVSDFIDLGGNSIQQMLLSSRLSASTGHSIPLRLVVGFPILGELVRAIEDLDCLTYSNRPEQAHQEHELSPIEKDWWQKYEMNLGSSAFNVSFVCKLGDGIDLSRLTLAWDTILARHRILSCRYNVHRRSGVTKTYSENPPRVQRVAFVDIWQEINRPFDLRRENPIGVSISGTCMVARISHIICDLTTLRTLLNEVASVYHGSCLVPIKNIYPGRLVKNTAITPSDLDFWTRYLANAPSPQQCAISRLQDRTSYSGTSKICTLPADLVRDMIDFAAVQKVTFSQMSLAAVAMALQHGTDSLDIVLGSPYLNRTSDHEMDTIGLFLEPLPTRIRYPPAPHSSTNDTPDSGIPSDASPAPQSFIHYVQKSSQAALSHAVPWTQLLEHLNITPDFPNHPLFDVMVTFHDDRQELHLPIPGCVPLYTWTQGAKFKLMTEFVAVKGDRVLLRFEYDTSGFGKGDVEVLQERVVAALRELVSGESWEGMRKRVGDVGDGAMCEEEVERKHGERFFGMEVGEV